MKSTYSLDIIINTLCEDDNQVDIIVGVLHDTLAAYQWEYQNTTDHQQYVNAESSATLVVYKVVALLKAKGQDTLADEVAEALYNDAATTTLTRSRVLSQAKKHMKKYLLGYGMTFSIYKNEFAVPMERAFIEWCEKYPLDTASASFDNDFEPPIF